MDSAAAPVPVPAAKDGLPAPPGSLLIRARLTSEENDSPLASDISEEEEVVDVFETASDSEEENLVSSLAVAAPAAHKLFVLPSISSMPVKAQLTRDDDSDGDSFIEDLEGEDDDDDDSYGVARIPISGEVTNLVDEGEVLDDEADESASDTGILQSTEDNPVLESMETTSDENRRTEGSQDENLTADEIETAKDANMQSGDEKESKEGVVVSGDEDLAVPDSPVEEDGHLIQESEEPDSTADEGVAESNGANGSSQVAEVEGDGETNGSCSMEVDMHSEETKSGAIEEVRNASSVLEPVLTKGDNLDHCENDLDQEKSRGEEEHLVSSEAMASSEFSKETMKELDLGSSNTCPHSAINGSKYVDGQLIFDSEDKVAIDEQDEGNVMIDSDALVALLKAASSSSNDESINVTSQCSNRNFMVDHPAGLGSAIASLKPAPSRFARTNLLNPAELSVIEELDNHTTEEQKMLSDKVQLIRLKFLRLVHRLGYSPEDTVAAQVLYRLNLAEGIRIGRQAGWAFDLNNATKKALQLEQDGKEDLDFSCNILVLGKSGVGKSATINSIFGEDKSQTSAFEPATFTVKEVVGIVDGVKIRVIDTPGLRTSGMDQASSRRILTSIKKYTKKFPPDIVLYVDRMDTLTRDYNDLSLLRTITTTLGPSIWTNAIVVLTHASSAPPEGSSGSPLSYEVFVNQRSHVVQRSIRLAAGDMRLVNPIALVDNHPSCRRNREGQRVLPNGLTWRSQMLLVCYSSKILSEANSILKLQDPSPRKLIGFRFHSISFPFLLSSLLQFRPHPKHPSDQSGDYGDPDMDLDDLLSDGDKDAEEDEYDQLPPFKPLKRSQVAKLTKVQRGAYLDEYDYRVKLLQKKQWKEELRRLKEMKDGKKAFQDDYRHSDMAEDFDQDNAPATDPVPLPDMVLPLSFDCDCPTYRYRFLEPTSQFLARPVLDTHGWDHDYGYDGVSLEESLAIAGQFPAVISAQVTKGKKEFSIHLDSSISAKHGDSGSTLAGFDVQAIGKQLAYIVRGETKFRTMRKNKTAGGISITFLGETVATGLKLEHKLFIGKRVGLIASTGAVQAQGHTAYGANLEAHFGGEGYPISHQFLSILGVSLMRIHGNLALGGNLQSKFSIGSNSEIAVRVGLSNRMSGQIAVKTSTSEQLHLALLGILPIAVSIFRSLRPGVPSTY